MKQFNVARPFILTLVGVSGSGKSTLEQNLLKDYPELFTKLQQFSTRKMRPGESFGNPYIFIQRHTFDIFQSNLIGVIGCAKDSLFKDKYGSLPDFVEGMVPTIILAEEGVLDILSKTRDKTNPVSQYKVFCVGLDVKYEDLSEEDRAARPNRDTSFIQRERNVLGYADVIYSNGNGKYVNPKEVVERLVQDGFLTKVEVSAEKAHA
jgi:hypothetical protein